MCLRGWFDVMNKGILPLESRALRLARTPVQPNDTDRVEVRHLFATLWRRKWVVLASMLICAVIAAALVGRVTPQYTAVSKIMLDPRERRVLNNREVVGNLDLREPVVNSEAAFLSSNVLIERVVRRIGEDRLSALVPPPAPASDAEPGPVSRLIDRLGGRGDQAGESPATVPAAPETAEARRLEQLVYAIRKDLTVFREGDSYVIAIRSVTTDPVLSMEIANGLAEEYIAAQLEGRTEIARRATDWLQSRVDALAAEVQTAEEKVQEFRAEALILEGGSVNAASQQLAELNSQAVLARADRVAAEARYQQIVNVVEENGVAAVADIVTSPMIEQLNEERVGLLRQDAVWAESFDEDHPVRTRLLAELQRIESDLGTEVQKIIDRRSSELEIARIRETALAESVESLEADIVRTAQSSIGLRQLEREAAASRATYEQMLARLNETRTQEQLQEPDARLIERATVPTVPSSPRPKLMTAVGGIAGVALGICLIFFLELTSPTFRTISDLERSTRLPVIAAVPRGKWRNPRAAFKALKRDAYSSYAERIRHIRTAVLTRGGKRISRSILLASSHSGEGKTTTALALARMTAMSGRSVLMLDCDLRRPTLHKTFNWKLEHDLADFIADRCSLDEAIYSDPSLGFDVLAASAPNPEEADQLSATWLRPMIEDLKKVYDVVLVDAPPILSVSDALVLADCVDTTLFLVRWNKTRREDAMKGISALEDMDADIAGVVMTMADPKQAVYAYGEARGHV